jgi:hypothetical protein
VACGSLFLFIRNIDASARRGLKRQIPLDFHG